MNLYRYLLKDKYDELDFISQSKFKFLIDNSIIFLLFFLFIAFPLTILNGDPLLVKLILLFLLIFSIETVVIKWSKKLSISASVYIINLMLFLSIILLLMEKGVLLLGPWIFGHLFLAVFYFKRTGAIILITYSAIILFLGSYLTHIEFDFPIKSINLFNNFQLDYAFLLVLSLIMTAISLIYISKIRVRNEEIIQQAVKEKDSMLKEIHHRVKNNMQIIVSLMNLQQDNFKDEDSKKTFRYAQNRIATMAMIHEILYDSDDLSKIDYKDYVDLLLEKLISPLKEGNNNVEFVVNIQNISFNLDTAIPLGLIINELATNAMKYAFNKKEKGKVGVKIIQKEDNRYTLFFNDNGIGIPTPINFSDTSTLGLLLVKKLTKQLKGSMEVSVENGTHFKIDFQELNS